MSVTTITIESYRDDPDHKAIADAIRDVYRIPYAHHIELTGSKAIISHYLANENGKRWAWGEYGARVAAETTTTVPWPPA